MAYRNGIYMFSLMTASSGLIFKLLTSGIAEKWTEEINFTDAFFLHVALYCEFIRSKEASLSSWREMLCAFHPALSTLEDTDVRTIVALIDYYLQKVESSQIKRLHK